MKKLAFALLVGLAAVSAQASWQVVTGGDFDDLANWSETSIPPNTSMFVQRQQSAPFTLKEKGLNPFFTNACIRYSGTITLTNDFGRGNCLTNIGMFADSGLHVEGSATLVHKSGAMHVCKGQKYDAVFISDTSTLIVDGPDAELVSPHSINMRSSSIKDSTSYPTLIVRNGGRVDLGGYMSVGSGLAEAHVLVTGEGSSLRLVGPLNVAAAANTVADQVSRVVVTNHADLVASRVNVGYDHPNALFEVSGGATATIGKLYFGANGKTTSNNVARISGGAVVTNTESLVIGGYIESGNRQADCGGDLLSVEGEGTILYTQPDVYVQKCATLRVADKGKIIAKNGITFSSAGPDGHPATLEFAGGTLETLDGKTLNGLASARVFGNGGRLESSGTLNIVEGGLFSVTNVDIVLPLPSVRAANVNVSDRASMKGGSLTYQKLYLKDPESETVFEDTVLTGGRFEMSGSNTVVRMENVQWSVISNDSTAIFMIGGANSPDTFPRHLYISGTNTYVNATANKQYGLFARGEDITFHFDIPAEGYSTAHPVFEMSKFQRTNNNKGIKVKITVDPELARRGGGRYTLFKGTSSYVSGQDVYEYDPKLVKLDLQSGQVDVIVKSPKPGLMVIIR